MNRLALMVATAALSLTLTACGEQGSKPAESKPANTTEQQTNTNQAAPETTNATHEENKATENHEETKGSESH